MGQERSRVDIMAEELNDKSETERAKKFKEGREKIAKSFFKKTHKTLLHFYPNIDAFGAKQNILALPFTLCSTNIRAH